LQGSSSRRATRPADDIEDLEGLGDGSGSATARALCPGQFVEDCEHGDGHAERGPDRGTDDGDHAAAGPGGDGE
jgi:hypothetical protein